MKYIILLLSAASVIAMSACNDNESNMVYMQQMKDSIFKSYPTVASITIDVKQSETINIVLGSKQLYNAPDNVRMQTANDLGLMAVRIFSKDTTSKTGLSAILSGKGSLKKGSLIVTADEQNTVTEPANSKTTVINIDSLKKAK